MYGCVKCSHCNDWVDGPLEDGICLECHVHSIRDVPASECGCSDCEETEREEECA